MIDYTEIERLLKEAREAMLRAQQRAEFVARLGQVQLYEEMLSRA